MSDFLLEIGVENLPASYIVPAFEQMARDTEALFREQRIDFDAVRSTGTPRRLIVTVSGVGDRQWASEEVVTGPPVSRAFDEAGAPTQALQGFARGQGVPIEGLERVTTAKGEYIAARRKLPRSTTGTILREALPTLVGGLRFPKAMKWEPQGTRFARPVRWIVALLGTSVVRFRFADVTSGGRTYGRPWMRGERETVRGASAHDAALQKLGVIADHAARRERIASMAGREAAKLQCSVIPDDALLDELTFMSENPRVLAGEFSPQYLDLPAAVVTTAMRSHQRYMALVDGTGRLAPRFITFTDGPVSAPAVVRAGNERVLRARLEDASFYWREDIKRGVDGLADELDRIVFIEGLGTIGEKWRRVERLALDINRRLGDPVDPAHVSRAARLAKADLASEMIKDGKEFTQLQGVIGSCYARENGEAAVVAEAIRDHYEPRTPSSDLPRGDLGRVIGIADRLDTIAGCFLAGFKPTGSQDPYALRRSGNGLVRIVATLGQLGIDELVVASLDGFQSHDATARAAGIADVREFMRGRVDAFLRDGGIPYDVAAAVIASLWMRPGVALSVATEIAALRGDVVFERMIAGVRRVGNILPPALKRIGVPWDVIRREVTGENAVVSEAAFEAEAEGALYREFLRALADLEPLDTRAAHAQALTRLSALAGPIDRFFDAVLVNAPEPSVRANRLALLSSVYAIFARYADFLQIVEAPSL